MSRHDLRPSFQCRGASEGQRLTKDHTRYEKSHRCGRRTQNPNQCCWQHQEYATTHPDVTQHAITRVSAL